MLEIVKFNEDEYNFPCLLVLGCFDGLHIGHAELLKKAKLQAKINGLDLGVMLFAEGKGGKQLYTFEERLGYLEQFNVKFVLKVDYNDAFKQIKPLDFLACLEDKLNVKAYMSGKDFRFGQGAKGKSSTIKSFAEDEENGVWYMPVKDVLYENEKVSTSLVKTLLEKGDAAKAAELLGRKYCVSGTVIHGAERGDKLLGYPTMNINYPENKFEVKKGVYKVKCVVDGEEYSGIANYGSRPTFGEDTPVLEVNLDGFDKQVYDEQVTVYFEEYIRDIRKFGSAEELAAQLSDDILTVKGESETAAADSEKIKPVEEPAPAEEVPAVEEPTPEESEPATTDIEETQLVEEVPVVEEQTSEESEPITTDIEETQPVEEIPAVEEPSPEADIQPDADGDFEEELQEPAEEVATEDGLTEVETAETHETEVETAEVHETEVETADAPENGEEVAELQDETEVTGD